MHNLLAVRRDCRRGCDGNSADTDRLPGFAAGYRLVAQSAQKHQKIHDKKGDVGSTSASDWDKVHPRSPT